MGCTLCHVADITNQLFFFPSLCDHSFHESCLRKWIADHREKRTGRYDAVPCPDCPPRSRKLDPDDSDFLRPAYRKLDFWIPAPPPPLRPLNRYRVVLEEVFPHEDEPSLEAVRLRAAVDLYYDNNNKKNKEKKVHLKAALIPSRPDASLHAVLEETDPTFVTGTSDPRPPVVRRIEQAVFHHHTLPRIANRSDLQVTRHQQQVRRERERRHKRHLKAYPRRRTEPFNVYACDDTELEMIS